MQIVGTFQSSLPLSILNRNPEKFGSSALGKVFENILNIAVMQKDIKIVIALRFAKEAITGMFSPPY